MSQDTDQPQQKEQGAQPQEQPKDQQDQQQQPPQQQDKNVDKKEIADEEREKMLNAENSKHTGAAPGSDLEAEEQKPKRKIPIGGIKMPGFCRSKSKEPCKDDDTKPIENDGEAKDGEATDKGAAREGGAPRRILEAIRVPLSNASNAVSSVFSRKKKQEADAELGTTGPAAGLASAETLDGADNQEKNNATVGDDGMETVRLDIEGGDNPPLKPHPFFVFLTAARRNYLASAATCLILLLVIIIVSMACVGPRRTIALPIIDGKITAQTSCGLVEGLAEEDALVFRGIPYAVPPVNDRRWKPAVPLNNLDYCWNGTFLAHNSSEMCWQRNRTSGTFSGSEDCLYLDIFTPKVVIESPPLAVVVMIGADTLSGPSPGIMLPSGKLSHVKDIVFVRPNFRLDVFGFLAVDPLSRDSNPKTSGNYGLHDIISVLQWVQLNIQYFGGDKTKVTLWGHRAGGTLVSHLIGARKAKGLFSRVWTSSPSIYPAPDVKESELQNKVFLEKIGCDDAVCLRNKKAEDLMKNVPKAWYSINDGLPTRDEESNKNMNHQWLVKDDDIIQKQLGEVFKTDLSVKVVIGTTAQSGTLTGLNGELLNYNSTDEDPRKIEETVQKSLFGKPDYAKYTELIFKKYNKTLKALHTMISDVRVVCPINSHAVINPNIAFYISTFPRKFAADVDSDAAAILGFFENEAKEKRDQYTAFQTFFTYFVYHGEARTTYGELTPKEGNQVLIIDQHVNTQKQYENCEIWLQKGPTYGRRD